MGRNGRDHGRALTGEHAALDAVLGRLRCAVCDDPVHRRSRTVSCPRGHAFDVARQGYVNLAVGARGPGTADTAAMVAARGAFLGGGHFAALAREVVDAAAEALGDLASGLVVDLAGGTGYYLAATLDANARADGLCFELSTPALRRAVRAHPRIAGVGADVWQRLPLGDGTANVVLSVFGPRNAAEIERVLAERGVLVVASPHPGHLRELIAPLGLIGVDPDKDQRQATGFVRFDLRSRRRVRYRVTLDHAQALAAVQMGPSAAHHHVEDLARRVATLPDPIEVGIDVRVAVYARSPGERSPE